MSWSDEVTGTKLDLSQAPAEFGWAGTMLERFLTGVSYGHIKIVLPSGQVITKQGLNPGPEAIILIRNWRMLRRVIAAGDIGFAEGFIEGDWTTPDLTAVIRFATRNGKALAPAIEGGLLMRVVNRMKHLFRANTRRGSRKNIEAHYDLGNDFYALWLDPSMLYSSAIFDETTRTLEEAQTRKLARIAEKLGLAGGESVLEIGCGWGALATHLAKVNRSKVTGITLSPSQLSRASGIVEKSGLSSDVTLRLQDYRDIDGQFDRIVSIEMFEAVGEAYWPSYFDSLKRCLKPGGRAVLQIISIEEERYRTYRGSTRFHPAICLPRRFPSIGQSLVGICGSRWPGCLRDRTFRGFICPDASGMANSFRGALAADRRTGFRRAISASVALLPLLLPGRVRGRHDQCRALYDRALVGAGTRRPVMKKMRVVMIGAFLTWGLAWGTVAHAADIDGQWARGDGNAKVTIAPCGSDICAVNTWIKPGTPKEKEGDKLVMSIKPDGEGVYSGSAFDPQRDLTYRITVTVKGDSMTTKGCIVAGLLCKGIDWTRID